MTCPDGRLEEFLDGELDGSARRAVEEHLASCEVCRRELRDLSRLEGILRAVPPGPVPEPEAFLYRMRARSRRGRRWIGAAAAAAILAAVVLAAGGVRRGGGGEVRETLARYAEAPSPAAEETIRRAGPAGLRILEEVLEGPDLRTRFAAASLLFRLGDAATRERMVARFLGPVDVRRELERYARAPSEEGELRIRSAGAVGMAVLEQALLEDRDARIRFAAATLLFRNADRPTRDWVLARFRQKGDPEGAWTLLDPGAEDEDLEIVPAALSALEGGAGEGWAMAVLQKMSRLDRTARGRIIGSVVTLLRHRNPRVQALALEIVKELDLDFPLSALVDLIDSPDLGEEALRVLRKAVGRDLGRDKEAWRKAVAVREKGL